MSVRDSQPGGPRAESLVRLLESAPIALLRADSRGSLVYVNPLAASLLGYRTDLGRAGLADLVPASPDRLQFQLENLMRKRFWCGRMEFESGEGATVSASVNVIVCPGLDNQDAVLAFLHPVAGGATATPIAEAEPTENTNLSAREVQVLMLASEGFTEEQIALILDVKVDVVVVHMQTAKAALGSTSSTEACIRAIKAGLIT